MLSKCITDFRCEAPFTFKSVNRYLVEPNLCKRGA